MWQDMGMCWVWRGKTDREDPPAPTKKVIRYAVICGKTPYKIAAAVVDISWDGKKVVKKLHQEEIGKCSEFGEVIHPSYSV